MEQLCKDTLHVVKETGVFIRKESKHFSKSVVEDKGLNQLVSYVDKTAEEKLVAGLSQLLPEAGFITEEATIKTEEKEWMWVIDPLDGTTNFIHQIPVYSISVGLMRNGITQLGVVYEINRDELFYSYGNKEAFMNGVPIRVKTETQLSKSLLATGFPYYDFENVQPYLNTLQEFMKSTQGMRRMGSAAVDLAYVACGRFDGFFEYGLNAWDVCGGAFIVQQAGGQVSDFKAGEDYIFGKEIIASSQGIYSEFQQIIHKHFYR